MPKVFTFPTGVGHQPHHKGETPKETDARIEGELRRGDVSLGSHYARMLIEYRRRTGTLNAGLVVEEEEEVAVDA